MSLQYLRDILDDLKARFGTALSPPSFQLSRQLNALDDLDKKLIRKKILGEINNFYFLYQQL